MTLDELIKNSEAVLALQPEELASYLLKALLEQEGQRHQGQLNRYNFSLGYKKEPEAVQKALMEAWAWLETSGCLAQPPQHQDGWTFVTRRGKQMAESTATSSRAGFKTGLI